MIDRKRDWRDDVIVIIMNIYIIYEYIMNIMIVPSPIHSSIPSTKPTSQFHVGTKGKEKGTFSCNLWTTQHGGGILNKMNVLPSYPSYLPTSHCVNNHLPFSLSS